MQGLDRAAIEDFGIPGVVLMENAGLGTFRAMEKSFGPVRGRSVLVFIGPGNNGGDGLVIARHVFQRGGTPYLVFLVDPEKLGGDAGINAAVVAELGLPGMVLREESDLAALEEETTRLFFNHPLHSMVDALFGTGLKRPIEGRFAAVVHWLNRLRRDHGQPTVAVDIPSGLSADTGQPLGCCVQADLTVTYGLAKPGHYHNGGPAVGTLSVVDIGIPPTVVQQAGLDGEVLDDSVAQLLRPRATNAHKGTCGHLLILAGSEGKTGAAILSARAALRSGCGLVTLAVPARLNPIFETALPEAMTVPLAASSVFFTADDYARIMELAEGKGGLVIGPGLGTEPATGELVRRLYSETDLPMVVDADALNLLAMEQGCIARPGGPRILTPHPGEMARLSGMSTKEIQADRLQAAAWLQDRDLPANREIITVLKGAGTVLHSSHGSWAINTTGNSGMAAGGMGDVLSGLLGGLLVQGYTPWDTARLGVYLHGLAADLLAGKRPYGYTASEVADSLPAAAAAMRESHI
jgi:NAD(P)H-hydrate epimerase